MDNRRKKKLTFFTIGLIFLLSGVEYAVILPTIWMYLQTLDAAPYFLGLALSAFSLTGLLSGPLFGHWSDRTRITKKIILFANFFELIGNFMYFMGYSKWLLLSSRLVAGIGTGAGSSIFGFLTRSTAPEDRATAFASVMACRQAGLLIGPAFNIFLRLCDFNLGPFVVNKYTAPGLFMCMLWILIQLAVIFMYWDLPPLEKGKAKHSPTGQSMEDERRLVEEDNDEERPLMGSQEVEGSYGSVVVSKPPRLDASTASNTTLNHISAPPSPGLPESHESSSPFKNFSISREFLREEVVVLLAAQFITLFNQTALETMVTPMTQKYFGYGELENSVMYCLCGVEVIAGFLFVRWLSQRVAERVVLAIGLTICNISGVWCLIFLANPLGGFPWQLTEFVIGVFLQVLGLPFVAVAQVSLFSKVTAEKTQGFSQGVRRSVGGLATILGPLWAGGLTENMYIMMGVMMALLALLTMMLAFSYERLVAPAAVEQVDESVNCG
ncbi:major facilitator superfamily domain-containing protein 8 [Etheostoma spectabile]|uniref:major facilitator superfamily domain-containing protein 8 n=1 Tax=Etheostoma spectabile TaxID=54343 RepID=UPI0013AEFD31|nr:major facilitator superfamily domain-containing protein 8-like [Etheostoma spectabile]XP_032381640.1 major facilitator superfamily domain-containing protein 8-like [Etheostoma spectabile]